MKIGKIDSDLLERIVFKNIRFRRPEVVTRPGIGEDCAVVEFGNYDCVLSTDPITGAVGDIGRLAVHISCNDIASNGIEPLGILLACMLPESTTADEIEHMMKQAGEAAEKLGVEIIGGHTEITAAVNQPVIVSTALGRAPSGGSQKAADMREGDYILLTKTAGLEGTAVIACDHADRLAGVLDAAELAEAKAMLDQVSVVREGVAAGKIGTAGMHDVTEGGVLGAVWEMCEIAGVGADIWFEDIPVSEITKKISAHFGIDWLRLISSGCMLIVAHSEQKDTLIDAIREQGVSVNCIGRVTAPGAERIMIRDGKRLVIDPPTSDELYKVVFAEAIDFSEKHPL